MNSPSYEAKWLEWHFVLGDKSDGKLQADFLLDFVKPLVDELKPQIQLFHFFRYFPSAESKRNEWATLQGFKEVEELLQKWARVNLITFRVRINVEDIDSTKEKIRDKVSNYKLKVYPVYGGEENIDTKIGLETYGGNYIHPIQHEYFHYISLVSLKLLELARSGRLSDEYGNPCGTETIAPQWGHMLLNQLGVQEIRIFTEDGKPLIVERSPREFLQAFIYGLICP